RKLVIESAKFNVITACTGAEALETFKRFPAVHGVILNASTRDIPCTEILATIRERAPKLPIIVVQGAGGPSVRAPTTTSTPSTPFSSSKSSAASSPGPLTSSSNRTTPSKPKRIKAKTRALKHSRTSQPNIVHLFEPSRRK